MGSACSIIVLHVSLLLPLPVPLMLMRPSALPIVLPSVLFNTSQSRMYEQLDLIASSYKRFCARQDQRVVLDLLHFAQNSDEEVRGGHQGGGTQRGEVWVHDALLQLCRHQSLNACRRRRAIATRLLCLACNSVLTKLPCSVVLVCRSC